MPPRPRHPPISVCGKCGAICSGKNNGGSAGFAGVNRHGRGAAAAFEAGGRFAMVRDEMPEGAGQTGAEAPAGGSAV